MKQTVTDDQTIIRYLLNELSADDQARFEETYLTDEDLFEQLRAVEEELIEDYVKGQLSEPERHRFERHYLASDQRRARIQTAKELVEECSLQSSVQVAAQDPIGGKFFSFRLQPRLLAKQYLTLGFGFAAILFLLLGAVLVIELLRLRGQLTADRQRQAALARRAEESERQLALEREQSTEVRKQSEDLRKELEKLNSQLNQLEQERVQPQASKNQIFLTLTPGIRDLGGPDKAVISAHTQFLALRLSLEKQEAASSTPYRVIVKTVEEGKELWTQEGIKPQRSKSDRDIVVRVPVNRLTATGSQDFMLTLSMRTAEGKDYEELESYYFQVISKQNAPRRESH